MIVKVVGAGLAGVEATWQLAKRGISVELYEMRPNKMTDAHKTGDFGELVCSNSFRSDNISNAVGLLKEEMRHLDSIIMQTALEHQLASGSALAVDRRGFALGLTEKIKSLANVKIINEEVKEVPTGKVILATGPLTSTSLIENIQTITGDKGFYFYDAAAPIVTVDSLDMNKIYEKSRYDYGNADYLNCPFTKKEFLDFYHALITAETAPLHSFEKPIYFEGCLPVEIMASRGEKTLLFGPLKPVGLEKPDGTKPYAVVQLRKDNAEETLYNLVGFQTHLKWKEQDRVFHMIPGLENAKIVRYGVMHRNTYICAPKLLKPTYQAKFNNDLFFAGQFSGVEGYIESAASGLLAGINMAQYVMNKETIVFPTSTMMGAMANYITTASQQYFQPMNANWGIFRSKEVKCKDNKHLEEIKNSLAYIDLIEKETNNG